MEDCCIGEGSNCCVGEGSEIGLVFSVVVVEDVLVVEVIGGVRFVSGAGGRVV